MLPRLVVRLLVVVIALAILAMPVVGVYVYFRSRQPALPKPVAAPVAAPAGDQGGKIEDLERTLLGIYLGMKDKEIKRPAGTDPTLVTFVVREGETAETIAQHLAAAGLITDADLFRQLVKYQGVGEYLQAGEYQLRATMTMEEVVAALQRSRQREIKVTVREGWRIEQIAEGLAAAGLAKTDDLLKAMRSANYSYSILRDRPAGATLEGYLFPDTYLVDPRWQADQIVDLLVATMDRRFTPAMRQHATERGLNVHKVLIIASLVEREAVIQSERPIIAAVYLNRLAKNMALEADSTVQYALGYDKSQQRWWPNLSIEELRQVESPYNTYLRRDLPPGPICSPGLSSIQAVLQPAKTDYLFYYSKGDGSHVFAKTFEEHLENQKKYQK